MPLVLDASVTAAWILPDEQTPNALHVRSLILDAGGLVPPHWWYEIRNTLLVAERRQRKTAERTSLALSTLGQLQIVLTQPGNDSTIFDVARRHRLSFYDAAYLALALSEKLPLATLDDALARAAIAEKVELVIPPA